MYAHRVLRAVVLLLMATGAAGYEASTHEQLSVAAGLRSVVMTDPSLFTELGLAPANVQTFTSTNNTTGNFLTMLRVGSALEDTDYLTRPFNHFFDPQFGNYTGRGLDHPIARGHASPDWALEDRAELVDRTADKPQAYSYRHAQQWFWLGLTAADPAVRLQAFSRAFQALGHVIHHIQDMGQPQHSRNDIHPSLLRERSFYERYTARTMDENIPDLVATHAYPSPTFPTARHFWHTPGTATAAWHGMAEFSSQNFVTIGSPFRLDGERILPNEHFPLPDTANVNGTLKRIVRETHTIVLWNGRRYTGPVDFVVGQVYDGHEPSLSRPAQRLAAFSVLDSALRRLGLRPVFAENSIIFRDGYPVLLPRAVAFSAGLINHFFRGRIDFRRGSDDRWILENRSGTWQKGSFVGQPVRGRVLVLHEDAGGRRQPLPNAGWQVDLAPGQATLLTLPDPPAGTRRLVAAFRGRIGSEGEVSPSDSGFYTVAGRIVDYTPPPVACAGLLAGAGSSEGYEAVHQLGSRAGAVPFEFEAYQIPDAIELRAENAARTLLAGTSTFVSGFRSFSISYDPARLGTTRVRVRVTGNPDPQTLWNFHLGCPGTKLDNSQRSYARVPVLMRWGTVLQGAMGACSAELYVDGLYVSRLIVSASGGPTSRTLTLTRGPGHGYEYRNYSCENGTRNILLGGWYTDTMGTYPLMPMSRPGVHYFDVN